MNAGEELFEALRCAMKDRRDERHCIARILHDDLAQLLTLLSLALNDKEARPSGTPAAGGHVRETEKIMRQLQDTYTRLSQLVRDSALDRFDLLSALRPCADLWARGGGRIADIQCDNVAGLDLPLHIEIALYCILHQAMTNVFEHANARKLHILIECRGRHLIALVEDDGVGFDAEAVSGRDLIQDSGIGRMRKLTAALGGHLNIESGTGTGSTVLVRLTLPAEAAG